MSNFYTLPSKLDRTFVVDIITKLTMQNSSLKKKTIGPASAVIVAFFVLYFAAFSYAESKSPFGGANIVGAQSGFSPHAEAEYDFGDVESINLFNGTADFAVPLLKVDGRGEAGYTIFRAVEIPRWAFVTNLSWGSCPGPMGDEVDTCHFWSGNVFLQQSLATFNLNLRPNYEPGILEIRRVGSDPQYYPDTGTLEYYRRTHTVVVLKLPNGGEQTLYDELHFGEGLDFNPSDPNSTPSPGRGRIFTSKDGTETRFVSDEDINDWSSGYGDSSSYTTYPSGYLYAKDGTVSRVTNAHIDWIQDSNGNKTVLSYNGSSASRTLTKVTDSNGREIEFQYNVQDGNGTGDSIVYKGTGGSQRLIRVIKASVGDKFLPSAGHISGASIFPELGQVPAPTGFVTVSRIVYPDNNYFDFRYNEYGEVSRLESRNGATVDYKYGKADNVSNAFASGQVGSPIFNGSPSNPPRAYFYRRIKERLQYSTFGNSASLRTTYSESSSQGNTGPVNLIVTVERADSASNLVLDKSRHIFDDNPTTSLSATSPVDSLPDNPIAGRELSVEYLDTTTNAILAKSDNSWILTCGQRTGCSGPENSWTMAVLESSTQQLWDADASSYLNSKKKFLYDNYGNVTDEFNYDYSSGSLGALLRRTHTNYLTTSTYTDDIGPRLISLPTEVWVSSDESGQSILSRTTFEYDNYQNQTSHAPLVSRTSVSGHDPTNFGSSTTVRGNITRTTIYTNAAGQSGANSTYRQYDLLGNVVKTVDANGNATTFNYDDNFGIPDGEATSNSAPSQLNGLSTFAFPSATTNTMDWTSHVQYDYYTGASINSQDVNGVISKTIYNDPLDRPTQSFEAVGSEVEKQSTTVYDDTNHRVERTNDLNNLNDNLLRSETFYDGFGRPTETRQYESSADYTATQTQYDALSRVSRISSPFRPTEIDVSHPIPWTQNYFDSLGRVTKVKGPDNSEAITTFNGNAVTNSDEAGNLRRFIRDAMGRLVRVDEPNAGGLLGPVSSPSQQTLYSYNALGNLIQINQGGQVRSFSYNSISQLLSATNPESGTFLHTYDANGNLLTKTDARGVVTTFTYDSLNRVASRSYSDGTPNVAYTYDDALVPFSRGKLTKISSSASISENTAYDEQERITASRQTTDGQVYDFGYEYNLDDDLVTQTYPSGKQVHFEYDSGGELQKVRKTGKVFADQFSYAAHGSLERVRYGNGKWETREFNRVRQLTQVGLGDTPSDTNLWKLQYDYGQLQSNGSIDPIKNNGNPARQTIVVPTLGGATGLTAVQTYSYDSLDRISSASESIGSISSWKQAFTYDRFGNRAFDVSATTLLSVDSVISKVANPEVQQTDNRIKQDQDNDGQPDYLYDVSGNITRDAKGQQFTYNAENLQTTAIGNNLSMTYAYDGNNKRIKSYDSVASQTTIYVYDTEGDLAAEYTINSPLPTTPTTNYLTEDATESVRVTTNSSGYVNARRDFLPFGEELYAGLAGRNTNQKYSSNADDTRKKFATYQRDVETGLDFAQSRYYSTMHGRFTSPDEFKGGPDELFDFEEDASDNPTFYADLENPQSLNKYQYAYNNPYKFNDPEGHCPVCLAGVAALAAILAAPDTLNAPGPKDPVYINERGSGAVLTILTGGVGKLLGPVIGRAGSAVLRGGRQAARSGATVVRTEVRARSLLRTIRKESVKGGNLPGKAAKPIVASEKVANRAGKIWTKNGRPMRGQQKGPGGPPKGTYNDKTGRGYRPPSQKGYTRHKVANFETKKPKANVHVEIH